MINLQSYLGMQGEYYLDNAREMASGFMFHPEGTFQFFFSYGALDRMGTGKWERQGEKVILNSAPAPASDFTLVRSSKEDHDRLVIRMEPANQVLNAYVLCSLEKGAGGSWKQMKSSGELVLPPQKANTISLILELCQERFSTIENSHPDHNDFTFRFEPTVMEVFFKDFSLDITNSGLSGRHPLLEGNTFSYSRQ